MQVEAHCKLYKTKDYDSFDLYEINRKVKKKTKAFKNLLNSMKQYGFLWYHPIVCVLNGAVESFNDLDGLMRKFNVANYEAMARGFGIGGFFDGCDLT